MKNKKFILALLAIIAVITVNCENKEADRNDNNENVVGNIIGYDPCSLNYNIGEGRGFIITIDKTSDTLLTYNLPGGLYLFSHDLFQRDNTNHYLFADSVKDKYAIRFSYKYANEDEMIFLCRWNIFIDEFGEKFKNRQVILKDVSKIK